MTEGELGAVLGTEYFNNHYMLINEEPYFVDDQMIKGQYLHEGVKEGCIFNSSLTSWATYILKTNNCGTLSYLEWSAKASTRTD